MKMLIYKISLILALVSIFLAGCYDDKGNYEYHDINRMTLKHAFFDSTLQMSSYADTLRIEPEVLQRTMNTSGILFEVSWKMLMLKLSFWGMKKVWYIPSLYRLELIRFIARSLTRQPN